MCGATHQVAAGDGRIGAIALLFAPVIGWVLFNIGTTAFHPPLNKFGLLLCHTSRAQRRPLQCQPSSECRSHVVFRGL